MKISGMGIGKLAAGASVALGAMLTAGAAWADDLLGRPTPGAIGLQPAASPLKHSARFFHDAILLPIITVITLVVLGLLLWVIFRYNKKANPTPARWSHNTLIEVIWTVVPVLILMVIAIFSFRLLFQYHDMPKADLTVKVTGYQWYWGYEYPDQGVSEITSTMLPEDQTTKELYRLAVDEPMVVPVGKTVRLLVTASDVIHAVALPAFGLKTDAIPGRVNETWFNAEKVGDYYGQCSELCGVDHAFMPIHIKVVTQPEFDAWVATKGGSTAPKVVTAAVAPAAAAPTASAAPTAAAPAPAAAATAPAAAPQQPAAPAAAPAPAAQ